MAAEGEELDLARAAFIDAHGRLQVALGRRDIWSWYAALGETLWWIVALDDHYRYAGTTVYESHRDGDAHGSVLPGLRFARNKVGHQLTLLVTDPCGGSVFQSADAGGVRLDQLLCESLRSSPPREIRSTRNVFVTTDVSLIMQSAMRSATPITSSFAIARDSTMPWPVRPGEDPLLRSDKG